MKESAVHCSVGCMVRKKATVCIVQNARLPQSLYRIGKISSGKIMFKNFSGGAREVLFIQEDRIELYIMKRRGFIRYDIKAQ